MWEHMNILAVSPHPDDIEYSISGTLLKIKKCIENVKITVVYNTLYDLVDDQQGFPSYEIRRKEAKMACRLMDAEFKEFSINDSIEKTAGLLLKVMPDFVFVPYPNDYNLIHRDTTEHIIRSIETARRLSASNENVVRQLLYYEAYSSIEFTPEFVINMSDTYAAAQKVLMCHKLGINILQSLPYKFQILHQLRGLDCSMPYGEGIIRDHTGQYNWNNNITSFFMLMYKLTHFDNVKVTNNAKKD